MFGGRGEGGEGELRITRHSFGGLVSLGKRKTYGFLHFVIGRWLNLTGEIFATLLSSVTSSNGIEVESWYSYIRKAIYIFFEGLVVYV